MKLSILICHLTERAKQLEKLLGVLQPQITNPEEVEIIIREDDGNETVGLKRNELLSLAIGDYVCFVDDDDMVPDYYVSMILTAIDTQWLSYPVLNYVDVTEENTVVTHYKSPDVVGFKGHYTVGDGPPQTFIHSLRYKEWKTVDGIHQRCPNHLNPVRRELALKAGFTEKDHGEDMDFSMALLPLLKTEVFVDKVMYFYRK